MNVWIIFKKRVNLFDNKPLAQPINASCHESIFSLFNFTDWVRFQHVPLSDTFTCMVLQASDWVLPTQPCAYTKVSVIHVSDYADESRTHIIFMLYVSVQ